MSLYLTKVSSILNKASYSQLIFSITISPIYLLVHKDFSVFTALLISGVASFFYTQLIKLGKYNKTFALFGFPTRLILIVPPCAILIHKLHSNLLALFIGFFLCQVIYFFYIWSYAKKQIEVVDKR